MNWLMRLLGRTEVVPPLIQNAVDVGEAANEAITQAHNSVESYWQTRRKNPQQRIIEDYRLAERRRKARRR